MAVDLNISLTKRNDLDRPLSKEEFDANYAKIEENFKKIAPAGSFFKEDEDNGGYTYDKEAIVNALSSITDTDASKIGERFRTLESKIEDGVVSRNAIDSVSVSLSEDDNSSSGSGSGDSDDKLEISIYPSWLIDKEIDIALDAELEEEGNYRIFITGNNIIAVSGSNIFITLEFVATMQGKYVEDKNVFSLDTDNGITLDVNVKSVTGGEVDTIAVDLVENECYTITLKNIDSIDEDKIDMDEGTYNGSFQAVVSLI